MSRRSIRHPGPPAAVRHAALACRAVPLSLALEPADSLVDSLARAFSAAGFAGGYVRLEDVAMARLDHVLPAPSPGPDHAAWYSAARRPPGGGLVLAAGLHMGRRDGAPFFHCHGLWRTDAPEMRPGETGMGHLLPFESALAGPATVPALGLYGAILEAVDDPETNFRLFAPVPCAPGADAAAGRPALLATIRPNEDVCETIEALCAAHGLERAEVFGIGSLVGADYDDGTRIDAYATEALVRRGTVVPTPQGPRATLDIALVDMTGRLSGGTLRRGVNPVCVTFELLIVG